MPLADLTDETTTGILNELCEVDYVGQTENGYYHGLRSQTPLRRYTSSVAQTKRMFDQPAEVDTQPEFNVESVNEAKLDAEVERLEQELEDELKR
ncbi:MarR family transcriptional regulator [Halomicroarcula sp. GCM10025710]